ncbi:MAG: DNA mismatch repair endonuclease MutL [Lachnospiraceae bacterium]|nr:DNA mismatch repair endonuclease MutL [Ruminococcus sp.]MCM1274710.1 DNA mismatch repair endonuclease MutL [Lachnospiraceae bacterium]
MDWKKMPKINQLDKSVYELIAAGEVIERPSSVIKELAENAIDAGARTISVEIKRGGITYMRVTDDGCGIAYEDMPLAFLRHATSKVYTQEDLENINTLGFRGEALASVAAVSRIEAVSKRPVDKLGTSYKIEGVTPSEYDRIGCADGTTIIIRDLFYNTPARLKFLKKDVTEGNYCANVIEKLALSHPNISFRFIRDGKQTLLTSGDGEYYSAIYAVFGKQFAAGMIPVDNIYRDIGVTGYVSSPLFTRANRTMQHFFVNGRSVKSPLCCAALEEAFRNSIMVGKFPSCVLCVNLDPALLDANISPAKTEVRFSNEKAVFDAIYFAVKNGLLGYDQSREIQLPSVSDDSPPDDGDEPVSTVTIPSGNVTVREAPEKKPDPESFYRRVVPFEFPKTEQPAEQEVLPEALPPLLRSELKPNDAEESLQEELSGFSFLSGKSFEKREQPVQTAQPAEQPLPEETAPESIRVIGELFKTYILCESGESLILIDKHAAHERINFERFKKGVNIHGQLLIEPREVSLSAEEYEAVGSFKRQLENTGILLRFAEDGKVLVDGLPQSLEGADPEELMQGIAEILANGNDNAEGALFDDVLHTMACKASIRANEDQDVSELAYLANMVLKDNNIRYCPHGRPVMTQISKRQIEKYFGRIV